MKLYELTIGKRIDFVSIIEIPPHFRTLKIAYENERGAEWIETQFIKMPFTQFYCAGIRMDVYTSNSNESIFKDNELYFQHAKISMFCHNTLANGIVCWGDVRWEDLSTPTKMISTFWSSTFNELDEKWYNDPPPFRVRSQ